MEQVVRDAIAGGMDEICFTDHVDYGIKQDWDCGKPILYRGEEPLANVDYPVYIARIKELQEKYGERIRIKIGIGSDSHKAEHLGAYIKEAGHLLKELGFPYFCTYEKQQPVFHGL